MKYRPKPDQIRVTIPPELRYQMQRARSKVNWAEAARRGIEEKLLEVGVPQIRFGIQDFIDGAAGEGISLARFVEDTLLALGWLMNECRDMRNDDPYFRPWYQELRDTAHLASEAIRKFEEVAHRYVSKEELKREAEEREKESEYVPPEPYVPHPKEPFILDTTGMTLADIGLNEKGR